MITASVVPLGGDYVKRVKTAFSARWIDIYPGKTKRAGAYTSNVYGLHPYILVNYRDTLSHAFTLSHELGHAVHAQLSSENQTFAAHSAAILSAEVAATFNEQLFIDHLLTRTRNPKQKIAILMQAARRLENTFYFQTMLADFELQAHRLVEQNKPVTADILNAIMEKLYADYYGGAVTSNKEVYLAWTRVHHLYRHPFYVYRYAASLAASTKLVGDVTKGPKRQREEALKKYLGFLASGGSEAPVNQLKKAGIDLTGPRAFIAPADRMNYLVMLLEKELHKSGI
jgi:oligoendopeptidase F